MKGKNHIVSTDAEKTVDKIQHPSMVKTLRTVGMEGNYLNVIKATHKQLRMNIVLSGERRILLL